MCLIYLPANEFLRLPTLKPPSNPSKARRYGTDGMLSPFPKGRSNPPALAVTPGMDLQNRVLCVGPRRTQRTLPAVFRDYLYGAGTSPSKV